MFPAPKLREIVFQLLFAIDANQVIEAELIPFLMAELSISKKHVSAALAKAQQVFEERTSLDAIIEKHSQNYSFARIKMVEKNVLRLALYELLIEKTLSPKIIFSEARRIARKFSAAEGASFVNALLSSLETDHGTSLSSQEEHPLK